MKINYARCLVHILFALVCGEQHQQQGDQEDHPARHDVGRDQERDPGEADQTPGWLERLEDVIGLATLEGETGTDLRPFTACKKMSMTNLPDL